MHATIPKGNMGYDQYTVPDTVAQSNLLLFLFLAPTNTRPWPLVSFFQTSLNESAFKTTHVPFGIVECTFSDNLSRNICIWAS